MFVIRCTRKLLRRLRAPVADSVPASDTVLGDWYANLLFTRPIQLVLFVSERSLLPVIVGAKDGGAIVPRFRECMAKVLRAIEVADAAIERELDAVANCVFAPTANRSVLGSVNEFARHIEWMYCEQQLLTVHEIAVELANMPCSPLGYRYPSEVARGLFTGGPVARSMKMADIQSKRGEENRVTRPR